MQQSSSSSVLSTGKGPTAVVIMNISNQDMDGLIDCDTLDEIWNHPLCNDMLTYMFNTCPQNKETPFHVEKLQDIIQGNRIAFAYQGKFELVSCEVKDKFFATTLTESWCAFIAPKANLPVIADHYQYCKKIMQEKCQSLVLAGKMDKCRVAKEYVQFLMVWRGAGPRRGVKRPFEDGDNEDSEPDTVMTDSSNSHFHSHSHAGKGSKECKRNVRRKIDETLTTKLNYQPLYMDNRDGNETYNYPLSNFNAEARKSKIFLLRRNPEESYHLRYYLASVVRLVRNVGDQEHDEKGEIAAITWFNHTSESGWEASKDDYTEYRKTDCFNFYGTIDRLPTKEDETKFLDQICEDLETQMTDKEIDLFEQEQLAAKDVVKNKKDAEKRNKQAKKTPTQQGKVKKE